MFFENGNGYYCPYVGSRRFTSLFPFAKARVSSSSLIKMVGFMSIIRFSPFLISILVLLLENNLFIMGILERMGEPLYVFVSVLLPNPPIMRIPVSGTQTVTDNSCLTVIGSCIVFSTGTPPVDPPVPEAVV